MDLSSPLYEQVDVEALDALLQGQSMSETAVEFEYESYNIRITSTGHLTVQIS
ncbi:HalOD1 output domain-containing protein [Natronomonas sp. EA1]|uniref:HalOD1 output domain-containing protein n=1 Tax=Natronomonas sp. EA1 TaxID=3421655 RepID=UPI003EBF0CD9